MNITVLTYDTLDSTNSEALRQAKAGAAEGLCIVARQQTAGRGRHGRTWISESDAGLYFSIVLRPDIEIRFLPLLTLMAGVAVHDTLSEIGLRPDIKWVNDVMVNGRKISGILAETTDTSNGLAVIVGIGINLRRSSLPPELADNATSVEEELDRQITPTEVVQTLTKHLARNYARLTDIDGPPKIIDAWRERSSYFEGKAVRVALENETFTGVTDGLEENGALRVKRAGGETTIVQAGDIQQLRSND